MPVAAWKNHCVKTPEPVIVTGLHSCSRFSSIRSWFGGRRFHCSFSRQGSLALVVVLLALVANCALYARGTTLGTYLGGFRLLTRRRQAPGLTYGLALTQLSFAPVLAIGFLFAVSFTPGNNASGFLGRPESHPLIGERTHRRRFLQAADDYWDRWAD